jgi:uncharacterized protein involved in tolerance to divalent cations
MGLQRCSLFSAETLITLVIASCVNLVHQLCSIHRPCWQAKLIVTVIVGHLLKKQQRHIKNLYGMIKHSPCSSSVASKRVTSRPWSAACRPVV